MMSVDSAGTVLVQEKERAAQDVIGSNSKYRYTGVFKICCWMLVAGNMLEYFFNYGNFKI